MPKRPTKRVIELTSYLRNIDGFYTVNAIARLLNMPRATVYAVALSLAYAGEIDMVNANGVVVVGPRGKVIDHLRRVGLQVLEAARAYANGCKSRCCSIPIARIAHKVSTNIVGYMPRHVRFLAYCVSLVDGAYVFHGVKGLYVRACKGGYEY